jgi:methionyl-tRNA formyltransferase
MSNKIQFAFFGTSHIAVCVLDALERAGLAPALIVTVPEKKVGKVTDVATSATAAWGEQHSIPVATDWKQFEKESWDVAVIVDYGKILPASLLCIPKKGFLNVHPSLLPRFRGASPMRSAILSDEQQTGVTIIRVDDQMDHGSIVAQKKAEIQNWPVRNSELEDILLKEGGALLANILPLYVADEITPQEQNHDVATYAAKFTKEDGLLDLNANAYQNLLKIYAFEGWPGTYAFFERSGKRIRVQIIDAHIEGDVLVLDRVKPEGKQEMQYADFARSGAIPLPLPASSA